MQNPGVSRAMLPLYPLRRMLPCFFRLLIAPGFSASVCASGITWPHWVCLVSLEHQSLGRPQFRMASPSLGHICKDPISK